MKGASWSKKEINILLNKYPHQGSYIPELNRTRAAIRTRASKLEVKVIPEIVRQNISKGYTIEAREKISNSKRGIKLSKEHKRAISKTLTGRFVSKETRKKMSKAQTGKKVTNEQREKMRATTLKQKPTFRNTSIEVALQDGLNNLGIVYKTHVPICNICIPDIVFQNAKFAIFADGDYWHNLPTHIKRDKRNNKILKENNWIIRRFWGHEIREDLNRCVDEILYVLNYNV